MATPYKFYLKHMAGKTGYRATWEPGKPLKLGMIGTIHNGIFDIVSSLEKEGLTASELKDLDPGTFDYTSSESVNINVKLAGEAPVAGSVFTNTEAGLVIDFKSENAIVFQVTDTYTHQIDNMGSLRNEIIALYKSGQWPKDWVVITELVVASAATIIVSNSSNNRIELKASANTGTRTIKLTDASLGLTLAKEKGSSLKVIAEKGITPLYRVRGIRHPFLGKPDVVSKAESIKEDEFSFDYQGFDEREIQEHPEVVAP